MKMSFKLEVFEGPLDLLLHLIAKHKLNINDIPIMILVEQYLNYISDMAEQDMVPVERQEVLMNIPCI